MIITLSLQQLNNLEPRYKPSAEWHTTLCLQRCKSKFLRTMLCLPQSVPSYLIRLELDCGCEEAHMRTGHLKYRLEQLFLGSDPSPCNPC